MKCKLTQLIAVILIAAFARQTVVFADGGSLRPRAAGEREIIDAATFDKYFKLQRIIKESKGNEEGLAWHWTLCLVEYAGPTTNLLIHGNIYVLKASPVLKEAEILSSVASTLKALNPKNTNPHLPALIGMVDIENAAFGRSKNLKQQALLSEYIVGHTLSQYYFNWLNSLSDNESERLFLILAYDLLNAYRITYAENNYVHGDIAPDGIMVVFDNMFKVERIVFVDNDTVSSVDDSSEVAAYKKTSYQPYYSNPDRERRVSPSLTIFHRRIPAGIKEACLPRDDIYSICAVLLEGIRSIQNVYRFNQEPLLSHLREVLVRYKDLANSDNALCSLNGLMIKVKELLGAALGTEPYKDMLGLHRIYDVSDFNSYILRPVAAGEKLTVRNKFIPGQFNVLKDFAEEPFAQIFPFMERNYPTNFKGEILGCSTSKQRCIASLIRFINVGSVFACVWQPFRAGTVATKILSSSFSIRTKNCFFSMYNPLSVRNNILYSWRSQGELEIYET